MKKHIIYIAAALLMASCSKDAANEAQQPVAGEPAIFSAVSASASRTTTALGEDGLLDMSWVQDDQVGIYATSDGRTVGYNVAYAATPTKDDATRCTFAAAVEGELIYWSGRTQQGFYAYYPYEQVADNETNPAAHPVTLPAVQHQAEADSPAHLSQVGMLVAKPVEVAPNAPMGGGIQFAFSHANAVVEIRLKSTADCPLAELPVKELKLTAANGVLAYPQATINLTAPISADAAPQLDVIEESASVTLKLDKEVGLKRDGYRSFFMVVAPGTHAANGLTLDVTAIDNSVNTVTIAEGVTLRANKHYVREYELSMDGFIQADAFEVDIPVLTTKVGEPLNVEMNGVADQVDFWSGEQFHDYAYIATDRIIPQNVKVLLKMLLQNGLQREPLAVKYSNNYTGELTEEAIQAATWTDASAAFSMPTTLWGVDPGYTFNKSTTEPSICGPVDATSWFAGEEDSCYVIFHYHIVKNDPDWVDPIIGNKGERGRSYAYIYGFDVTATPYGSTAETVLYNHIYSITTIDGKKQFADVEGAPYIVHGATIDSGDWGQPATYSYTVNGQSYPYVFRLGTTFRPTVDKDMYVVFPLLKRPAPTNVGPDKPIAVQSRGESTPKSWSYTFTEAGTYRVVVEATVTTLAGETKQVKEYTVEVTE